MPVPAKVRPKYYGGPPTLYNIFMSQKILVLLSSVALAMMLSGGARADAKAAITRQEAVKIAESFILKNISEKEHPK